MKTFVIAALAATVLATPVLAAPYQGQNDRGRIEQRHDDRRDDHRGHDQHRDDHRGYGQQRFDRGQQYRYGQNDQYRGWRVGERFDHARARDYRVIDNPRYYRLHDAPRGYRWVRSGRDAVLIGMTTGIIASVIANSIR